MTERFQKLSNDEFLVNSQSRAFDVVKTSLQIALDDSNREKAIAQNEFDLYRRENEKLKQQYSDLAVKNLISLI